MMDVTFNIGAIATAVKTDFGIVLLEDEHHNITIEGDDDEIMDLLRKIADLFNAEVKYREDPDKYNVPLTEDNLEELLIDFIKEHNQGLMP